MRLRKILEWCQTTRNAYTEAYDKLKRRAVRFGPAENQCIRVYHMKCVPVTVKFQNENKFHKYWHLPYKLSHLRVLERDPPSGKEISHLCGNRTCINTNHMCQETRAENRKRDVCHAKIRARIRAELRLARKKGQKPVYSKKYTYRECFEKVCQHGPENECFIMIGEVKKDGTIRRHKKHVDVDVDDDE